MSSFVQTPSAFESSLPVLRKLAELEQAPWGSDEEQKLAKALRSFHCYQGTLRTLAGLTQASVFRRRTKLDASEIWQGAAGNFAQVGHQPVTRQAPVSPAKSNRILFLSGVFPSLRHGGGVRVFDIISELSKLYEVDLFATFDVPEDQQSLELLKTKLRRCHTVQPTDFNPSSLQAWLKTKHESLNDYKVIHLEWHHTHRFLEALSKSESKIIFTLIENIHRAHFLRLRQLLAANNYVDAGRMFLELGEMLALEEKLWKGVDERIVVSDADGLTARALFGLDCHTVLTGVSETAILNDLNSAAIANSGNDGPSAGFVGYFTHPPNLEGMAWYLRFVHPLVKDRVPNYKIRVIGGGDTSALKREFTGDPSIEFTGYVDNIVSEIRKNTICISPLISGAGLRGKLIQYSICGKASVSTPIGASGLPFVHQESVMIAAVPREFADLTVALLTQPELRERIASHAKAEASKHFSWDSIIPKITRLYEESR